VEDALSAYEYLMTVAGYDANHIVVAGDCAGGGLAAGKLQDCREEVINDTIALILSLKERQQPLPAALVMLSPLVDLSELVDEVWKSKKTKDLVTPYEDHLCAKTYCGANDPRNPMLSPIYGDLTGFPPTLIQV
jgi:acetyl esterase/lipase